MIYLFDYIKKVSEKPCYPKNVNVKTVRMSIVVIVIQQNNIIERIILI